MLCSTCLALDMDELDVGLTFVSPRSQTKPSGCKHHSNFHELMQSAKQGCELCQLILDSFERGSENVRTSENLFDEQLYCSIGDPHTHGTTLEIEHSHTRKGGSSDFCVYWLLMEEIIVPIAVLGIYIERGLFDLPIRKYVLNSRADTEAGQPGVNLISGRPRFTNPASEECFSVAKGFLEDCLSNHSLCRADFALVAAPTHYKGNEDDQFPTRTIDLGPADSPCDPSLTLHSPDEGPFSWVTLSHRWSGHFPLMTTISNYEEMKRGIPMDTLPLLFQDAVTITKNLNLRHLWIDSLCIIQDSPEDKEREISKMGNIYRNATLSIAADASDNCSQRILKPRLPEFVSVSVPFESSRWGVSGNFFIRLVVSNWDTALIWGSRLKERAWVLQETLLARRTLHYCEQEMLWECRVQCTAESNLAPVAATHSMHLGHDGQSTHKSDLFLLQTFAAPDKASEARETMYMRYYTIIENYTSRKLTKPEDRLPAFSGLASWFELQLNDTYQAGLFTNDLLRGLLWETRDRLTAKYPATYRAPSWSWASIEAPMNFMFLRCRGIARTCHAEVLYVETHSWSKERTAKNDHQIRDRDTPSEETFSQYPKWLAPKTTMSMATTVAKRKPSNFSGLSDGLLTLRGPWRDAQAWQVSKPEDTTLTLEDLPPQNNGKMFCKFDVASPATVLEHELNRGNIGFLHIISDHIATREEGSVWTLILERTGRSLDEYRRIGIGVMSSSKVASATEKWGTKTVRIV